MSLPVAQLSCEQCQRRKIRCNKTVPCSACTKAEITCTAVQRQRLPRGKSGKLRANGASRQALRERVARLEALVLQLHQQERVHQDPKKPDQNTTSPPSAASHSLESFVAPEFWSDLSSAVAGLKEVLEHSEAVDDAEQADRDDIPSPSEIRSKHPDTSASSYCVLLGAVNHGPQDDHLPPEMKSRLLDVYKERIDSLFKPLHWLSTLRLIHASNLGALNEQQSINANALEHAMYFASACSLLDHELDGRHVLVEHLRRKAERTLGDASLLTTTSITVLQAFVIYLTGVRACQANAQQWTLTATAVRLASAQGMPSNLKKTDVSLHMEVRRRLWQCVGILDLQSAFDRGSQPLLSSFDLQSLPANVNDDELEPSSTPVAGLAGQSRWTDMSLSIITYQAGVCQRRLTEIGYSAASQDEGADPTRAGRQQVAVLADFESHVKQLVVLCGPLPSLAQRYAMAVAEESLVAMRLILHRPLHRRINGHVPVDYLPDNRINILEAATEVLEHSQVKRTQQEFAPWAWSQWVKWYALAVVLAELCGASREPLADRAWNIAQICYSDYVKDVADSKRGLLWKPIMRLMGKVQDVRQSNEAMGQPLDREVTQSTGSRNTVDSQGLVAWSGTATSAMRIEQSSSEDDRRTFPDQRYLAHDSLQLDDSLWFEWDLFLEDFNDPLPLTIN